jgi:hypothetical protein
MILRARQRYILGLGCAFGHASLAGCTQSVPDGTSFGTMGADVTATATADAGSSDATTGDGDGGATTTVGDGDGDGVDTPGGVDRMEDPVVILGAQLPGMSGQNVDDLVAFARQGGVWTQVPVQVDERVVQDFCEIYGKSSGLWTGSPACKTDQVVTALFYTDTETFTGRCLAP